MIHPADLAALAFFVLCWAFYEPLLRRLRGPAGVLNSDMARVRVAWMLQMSRRESRFMDGQLLGHALVPRLGAADRPLHRRRGAYLVLPVLAHLAQVIGEDVGAAAALRAVDDLDRLVGQVDAGVQLLDGRVVPAGDLAR